jgi:hypothetical protein
MLQAGMRQILVGEMLESISRHAMPLASSPERPEPNADHFVAETS